MHKYRFRYVGLVKDEANSAWNHAAVAWHKWRSLAFPPQHVPIRSLVYGNTRELNSMHVHTQLAVVRWRLMSCRFTWESYEFSVLASTW